MKKQVRVIALVMAAVLLMCCLTGCGAAGRVRDTLKEFERACRSLDGNAILDCVEPEKADPIRMILALYSDVTNQDYDEVSDGALANLVHVLFGTDFDPNAFLSNFTVTDTKLEIEDETAVVTCVIHFEVGGEKFARDASIVLVEIRDQWYISDIDLSA